MSNVFLFSKRKPHFLRRVKPIKTSSETHSQIINDLLCLHNCNNIIMSQQSSTVREYMKKIKEKYLSDVSSVHTHNNNSNKNKPSLLIHNNTNNKPITTPKLNKTAVHLKCITPIIPLPYDAKINFSLIKESSNTMSKDKNKSEKNILFSNEKILFSIMNPKKENVTVKKILLSSSSIVHSEKIMLSTGKQSSTSNLSLGNICNKDNENDSDRGKDKENNEDRQYMENESSPMFYLNRDQYKNMTINVFKSKYNSKDKYKEQHKEKDKETIEKCKNLTYRDRRNNSSTNNCEFIFKKIYFPEIKRNSKQIYAKKEQINIVLNQISSHFKTLKNEILY